MTDIGAAIASIAHLLLAEVEARRAGTSSRDELAQKGRLLLDALREELDEAEPSDTEPGEPPG